jgi:hypothetical protein
MIAPRNNDNVAEPRKFTRRRAPSVLVACVFFLKNVNRLGSSPKNIWLIEVQKNIWLIEVQKNLVGAPSPKNIWLIEVQKNLVGAPSPKNIWSIEVQKNIWLIEVQKNLIGAPSPKKYLADRGTKNIWLIEVQKNLIGAPSPKKYLTDRGTKKSGRRALTQNVRQQSCKIAKTIRTNSGPARLNAKRSAAKLQNSENDSDQLRTGQTQRKTFGSKVAK